VLYEISSRASTPTRTDRTHPRTSCGRSLRIGLPEAVASDIELLATEIVSNAVRHAGLDPTEEIILRIVADGYVRVEVTDPGPPFEPELGRLAPGPSGWGLLLVDTIAAAWGVEAEGIGKKVWFELG
jgi:anti-sigma regulatory factor (Ser/Thr protein kinase)